MENIKIIIMKYMNKEINIINVLNMYYEIGEYACNNEISLLELELYLKSYFGLVISFTRRNIKNMMKLYKKYNRDELIQLKEYKWIQIIEILENKKVNNYCKDESLNELKRLKNML